MTETRTNWSTYAYAILTIVVGFVGAPLFFAGGVLAWSSATEIGKALGLGCAFLAIAIQPIAWRRRIVGSVFALAGLGLLTHVLVSRSSVAAPTAGGVRLVGPEVPRLSPMRIVPEVDQLLVATNFFRGFSPDGEFDSSGLRTDIRSVYGEFDDAFRTVPSLLDDALADECSGRAFVWPPATSPADSEGAPFDRRIVFVHGRGGSWSGYLRVMRPVANAIGATLVQPSCGGGRWTSEAELDTFARSVTGPGEAPSDASRVHVVSLSDGGLAVSRRLDVVLARASSLVFVSSAFDLAALEVASRAPRPVPVLVIHGDADPRISTAHVEAAIQRLRRLQLDVRLRVLEGADHFAFFHEREVIRREIEAFLGEVERSRARP